MAILGTGARGGSDDLSKYTDAQLRQEIKDRLLRWDSHTDFFLKVACDDTQPADIRCGAILGLSQDRAQHATALLKLISSSNEAIAYTATAASLCRDLNDLGVFTEKLARDPNGSFRSFHTRFQDLRIYQRECWFAMQPCDAQAVSLAILSGREELQTLAFRCGVSCLLRQLLPGAFLTNPDPKKFTEGDILTIEERNDGTVGVFKVRQDGELARYLEKMEFIKVLVSDSRLSPEPRKRLIDAFANCCSFASFAFNRPFFRELVSDPDPEIKTIAVNALVGKASGWHYPALSGGPRIHIGETFANREVLQSISASTAFPQEAIEVAGKALDQLNENLMTAPLCQWLTVGAIDRSAHEIIRAIRQRNFQ